MNLANRPFKNVFRGPIPEVGDRVQYYRANSPKIPWGSWGTVIRVRGLGYVTVQLDNGQIINTLSKDLQFEKWHASNPLQEGRP